MQLSYLIKPLYVSQHMCLLDVWLKALFIITTHAKVNLRGLSFSQKNTWQCESNLSTIDLLGERVKSDGQVVLCRYRTGIFLHVNCSWCQRLSSSVCGLLKYWKYQVIQQLFQRQVLHNNHTKKKFSKWFCHACQRNVPSFCQYQITR